MNNMKIGIRLGATFALAIVLFIATTIYTSFESQIIRESSNRLISNNFPKIRLITDATKSVQDITRDAILFVTIDDADFRKSTRDRLDKSLDNYQDKIKQIEKMPTSKTPSGREYDQRFANFKTAVSECLTLNKKAMDSSLSGNQAEGERLLKTGVSTISKVIEASDILLKEQYNTAEGRIKKQILNGLNRTQTVLISTVIIAAIISGVAAFLITRSITRPLGSLKKMLNDIAHGEGDLTKRLDASSKDEIGQVAALFNQFVDKLHGSISKVTNNSYQVAAAAVQLNATAKEIASVSEMAVARVSAVATAGEEMSATSSDIARNCGLAADGARHASNAALDGAKVVNDTISVMSHIATRVQASAKAVENLGNRSEQIGEIVGTIEDIADQTNLLALNAAIEAARAGEQGRGFAVVADEVRALAERTTKATKEISEMIKTIQNETKVAVAAMNEGVNEVTTGSEKASLSGKALELILEQINDVTMQINQVATAAEEQTATTSEISGNMHQISEVINQAAKGANDSAAASSRLAETSDALKNVVSQFRL